MPMEPRFFGTPVELEALVRRSGITGWWGEDGTGKRIFKDSVGGILNWAPVTGSIWFQGTPSSPLLRIFDKKSDAEVTPFSAPKVNSVFVVHGHDLAAVKQIETLLIRLDIQPRILIRSSGGGKTLIEALEDEIVQSPTEVDFGIVLLTPDDFGYAIKDGATKAMLRGRQNVILEMGMLISKLRRKKVAILVNQSQGKIELPSDIDGVIYLTYETDITKEAGVKLVQRFREAGLILNDVKVAEVLAA